MVKITLSNSTENSLLAISTSPKSCKCNDCAVCVWCLVFTPVVGFALATVTAISVTTNHS